MFNVYVINNVTRSRNIYTFSTSITTALLWRSDIAGDKKLSLVFM